MSDLKESLQTEASRCFEKGIFTAAATTASLGLTLAGITFPANGYLLTIGGLTTLALAVQTTRFYLRGGRINERLRREYPETDHHVDPPSYKR